MAKKYSASVKAAIKAAGGLSNLAAGLGIKPQSVTKWKRIPEDRIVDVEKLTGIPREKLRPNLYAR